MFIRDGFLMVLLVVALTRCVVAEELEGRQIPASLSNHVVALLHSFIAHHPRTEIRHDLDQLIKTGKVAINFQEGVFSNHMLATAYVTQVEGHGLMPSLHLNPAYIADPNVDTRYKQLVIFHEYIHLDQMLRGRAPLATFKPKLATKDGKPPSISAEDAVTLLRAEIEAYQAECELGKEIGYTEEPEFCKTLVKDGEEAFRMHVVRRLIREFEGLQPHRELLYKTAAQPFHLLEVQKDVAPVVLEPTSAEASRLMTATSDRLDERKKIREAAIAAAEEIAKLSENETGVGFAKLLREGNRLCVPVGTVKTPAGGDAPAARRLEEAEGFGFLVLFPSDVKYGKVWDSIIRTRLNIACWSPEVASMTVSGEYNVSPRVLGLVLHHEMVHLTSAPTRGKPPTTFKERMEEEREAYTYEFMLLRKIGGEPYEKALAQEAERIGKEVAKNGEGGYGKRPDYEPYATVLDGIFGKPSGEDEKKVRATLIFINGMFKYLDDHAAEKKAEIMGDIYGPKQ